MKISVKLAYQYIAIFLNFLTTLNHLHPLQVENCDSNSRLVVDEDDNGKSRPERVNAVSIYLQSICINCIPPPSPEAYVGLLYLRYRDDNV